jgi:hypothetical protein
VVTERTVAIDVSVSLCDRLWQLLLIASTLCLSWLLFMAVHELGHVLGAWITGARIVAVVLGPLRISETRIDPELNPLPLLVVWAGPVIGAAVPLAIWDTFRRTVSDHAYLVRFFAGFCLVANGAYIGADSFYRNGDGFVMIQHGTPRWAMLLFAACTVPLGFWIWHGVGRRFGLGRGWGRVDRADAVIVTVLLAAVIGLEVAFFPWRP